MKLINKILGWFKSKPAERVEDVNPPAAAPTKYFLTAPGGRVVEVPQPVMEVIVKRTPKRQPLKIVTHKKASAMKWAHTISGYKPVRNAK